MSSWSAIACRWLRLAEVPEINTLLKTVEDPSLSGIEGAWSGHGRAAKRLQDEGIDLPEYDILNVVDDMEAARKALATPPSISRAPATAAPSPTRTASAIPRYPPQPDG